MFWRNALWGTTFYGGISGKGSVFEVTAPNAETNIYSFTGLADGGYPEAGLTNGRKFLYGDTTLGANSGCSYYGSGGCGTIFEINWYHAFTTIYSFSNNNGGEPFDSLLLFNRHLWGTTYGGGANGYGTVFKFGPVP